jgi:hypothetical protein
MAKGPHATSRLAPSRAGLAADKVTALLSARSSLNYPQLKPHRSTTLNLMMAQSQKIPISLPHPKSAVDPQAQPPRTVRQALATINGEQASWTGVKSSPSQQSKAGTNASSLAQLNAAPRYSAKACPSSPCPATFQPHPSPSLCNTFPQPYPPHLSFLQNNQSALSSAQAPCVVHTSIATATKRISKLRIAWWNMLEGCMSMILGRTTRTMRTERLEACILMGICSQLHTNEAGRRGASRGRVVRRRGRRRRGGIVGVRGRELMLIQIMSEMRLGWVDSVALFANRYPSHLYMLCKSAILSVKFKLLTCHQNRKV